MQQDPEFVRDLESKAAAGDSACQAAVNCLKAMRSVLATRGCAGNSTAYFAAAVTTLVDPHCAILCNLQFRSATPPKGPNPDKQKAFLA